MESLQEQIDRLKKQIQTLGDLAEQAVSTAVASFVKQDRILAESVIAADKRIDLLEIEVEELCHKILAQKLDNSDLRFVVAVLKINNDLERIGDLASNIAKNVIELVALESFRRLAGCDSMAQKSENMVRQSLKALLNRDAILARKVIELDDEVDDLQRSMQKRIVEAIERGFDRVPTLLKLNFIVRQLERVGDMATNIAEDVLYMSEGDIVRHEALRRAERGTNAGRRSF